MAVNSAVYTGLAFVHCVPFCAHQICIVDVIITQNADVRGK